MTLGWPWPILRQGQIWSLMLLYGEKGKTMDFLETIVVYDLKLAWPKWQEVSVDIKTLSPGGYMPPALGLYTCIKSWKKMYKIRLQRDFFETCNKWVKW